MTDDQHLLAGAYALDALTPAERRDYEAHFPTCEICTTEVAEFRATAARLADAASVSPPSDLKARVMAEVAVTRQLPPVEPATVIDLSTRRRLRAPTLLLGAAAAALVVVVASVATLRTSDDAPSVDDLIAAPDAVITALEGDGGSITVVWSPDDDRVAVVGNDLPDPGPGRAYALWFLLDDGVAPAGLFTPRGGAIGHVFAVDDLTTQGWGITIEPATGSPQPTGDILFSGIV